MRLTCRESCPFTENTKDDGIIDFYFLKDLIFKSVHHKAILTYTHSLASHGDLHGSIMSAVDEMQLAGM